MLSTAGPAHRVQSAVIEYGFPQGHLGHLTQNEDAAFAQFKVVCQEKGYYKPSQGTQPASHDDALLLRFLRARRFNVQDALKQFTDTEHWRKANQLDELYETIDLEHYEETRQLYPQWTGRRDRRGIPVYVYEVKHLNSKRMSAYEKSATNTKSKAKSDGKTAPKLLRLFALYENLTRFVMPLCSALTDREYPNTPITQSNNIVDISGVGLKQFWNLRSHMQDASTLATAHYPETLDRVFIIGAPSFFPTVWSWIKKWFDPITTSKIFILSSHDMKSTLESFIDPSNIPIKYGGTLPFKWGDDPLIDPALSNVVTWDPSNTVQGWPKGPIYWRRVPGSEREPGSEPELEAIAVGLANGIERSQRVCSLRKLPHESNVRAPSINNEGAAKERPDLMRAPTADEFVLRREREDPSSGTQEVGEGSGSGSESGQDTPNLSSERPTLEKFVTAAEGRDLSIAHAEESSSTMVTPIPGRAEGGFEHQAGSGSADTHMTDNLTLMQRAQAESNKLMDKI